MDYSYFTAAPQAYTYTGFPPTPGHTGHTPTHSDEFGGGGSPISWDSSTFHYHDSVLAAPQSRPSSNRNSLNLPSGTGIGVAVPEETAEPPLGYTDNSPPNTRARSTSSGEEKENLTPAQSRRKAQNRAAQRAFRERKERHVKDLEAKLSSLQQSQSTLSADNERLKREMARLATENEILRATSSGPPGHSVLLPDGAQHTSQDEDLVAGNMKFSPIDLSSRLLIPSSSTTTPSHSSKDFVSKPSTYPTHRLTISSTGERLLSASATWDFILATEEYAHGLVDVADVCERLKREGKTKCDGQGPCFEEQDIRRAIQESCGGGTDGLI
ncbi:MAG: hypothetical protein M1834_003403 [Cirrosporium novae-zelandiae]|nr:MAG: hypothetical protein M1834_003403 [Cirrosporium novae-zelandiae]